MDPPQNPAALASHRTPLLPQGHLLLAWGQQGQGMGGAGEQGRGGQGSTSTQPAPLPSLASLPGRPRWSPGTHVRVIVHCGDQVLHQGLQGPEMRRPSWKMRSPEPPAPPPRSPCRAAPVHYSWARGCWRRPQTSRHSFLGGRNGTVRHQRLLPPSPPSGQPQEGLSPSRAGRVVVSAGRGQAPQWP